MKKLVQGSNSSELTILIWAMFTLQSCREVLPDGTMSVNGEEGEGIPNADFVLYVSADETDRCDVGTTVAYAAYCQLESERDRCSNFLTCLSSFTGLCSELYLFVVFCVRPLPSQKVV